MHWHFLSFVYECTRWKSFQKRVGRPNVDLYYQWVDISTYGLLALDYIILPVDNTSALPLFLYTCTYIFMLEISSSLVMWLIKIKVYLHEVSVTLDDFGYDVHAIWLTWPQRPLTHRYSAFQSFDYGCTRCRSFQKHVMPTKLDVSVFIVITGLIPLLVDYYHHPPYKQLFKRNRRTVFCYTTDINSPDHLRINNNTQQFHQYQHS